MKIKGTGTLFLSENVKERQQPWGDAVCVCVCLYELVELCQKAHKPIFSFLNASWNRRGGRVICHLGALNGGRGSPCWVLALWAVGLSVILKCVFLCAWVGLILSFYSDINIHTAQPPPTISCYLFCPSWMRNIEFLCNVLPFFSSFEQSCASLTPLCCFNIGDW